MAIWQFDVALVPDESARPPGAGGPRGLFALPDAEVLRRVDAILPRRASWSDDSVMWGEEGGHRVEGWFEGGRLVGCNARVDLRQLAGPFLDDLLALAVACGASLSVGEGRLIPPERSALAGAIRESAAFRFALDPAGFFDELARQKSPSP